MRRASSVLLPSLGPSWHPSDGPGLTAFPTGVMDASERDQTVPKLTGWAGSPGGLWGGGSPSRGAPLWGGQCSSSGCGFSSGCGARCSLDSLGSAVPPMSPSIPWDRARQCRDPLGGAPRIPQEPRDAPAAWPQHVGTQVLGKKSAWELSGDFPVRAGIWEFSALPLVPSFLTHTLLPGSQTALKKATAHTMLFPSAAGAADEIPHPAGDLELALAWERPCQLSHTMGLPWPHTGENHPGSHRCILPWALQGIRPPSLPCISCRC